MKQPELTRELWEPPCLAAHPWTQQWDTCVLTGFADTFPEQLRCLGNAPQVADVDSGDDFSCC